MWTYTGVHKLRRKPCHIVGQVQMSIVKPCCYSQALPVVFHIARTAKAVKDWNNES